MVARMSGARKTPAALLASPVFAGSIAVLIINDHVLKSAWPGFVTGKLSDVAGCLMVAVVLTAVLRRAGAACVATAVAFTVLKVLPAAPIWAAPLLGGATHTDPADLAALAALIPLWLWLSRRGSLATKTGVVSADADRAGVARAGQVRVGRGQGARSTVSARSRPTRSTWGERRGGR